MGIPDIWFLSLAKKRKLGKKTKQFDRSNRTDFVTTTENLKSIIKNKFLTISYTEQALKLARCSFRFFFFRKIYQSYEPNKRYLCELKRNLAVVSLKNQKRVSKRAKNEFFLNLNIM